MNESHILSIKMRLDADDDSVKGRFGVATWKAAFCDCGAAILGAAWRGEARRGAAKRGAARVLKVCRWHGPPCTMMYLTHIMRKRWGKFLCDPKSCCCYSLARHAKEIEELGRVQMSVSTKRTHQEFKTDKILDKRTPLTSTNGSKCCQSTFQGGFSAPVSSSVRRRCAAL